MGGISSFSATGWDSVNGNVYGVSMQTKKGEVLNLLCDAGAGWNTYQLTGTYVAGKDELAVVAQRNAFGKQWFFSAEGDANSGWTLHYAENAKAAALTLSLSATGSTSISGKLGGYAVKASGYVDMAGIESGALHADFAPIVKVGKEKKALSLRTNLWFDRKNDHVEGVGRAVFTK